MVEPAVSSLAPPPKAVGPSPWVLDARAADELGVVGVGADLEPETLVDAYRRGIFPWPHEDRTLFRRRSAGRGTALLPWFSPDPRGVLLPGDLRVSKSLRQRLRRSGWTTTVDADFGAVVEACSHRPAGEPTWITPAMQEAYGRLNRLGWAHSVEVWDGPTLVGGLYGVRVGACFTGESMFHLVADASKVAFVDLLHRWTAAGGRLVDVQLMTEHLERLGAREMVREDYLELLAGLRDQVVRMRVDALAVSRLVG